MTLTRRPRARKALGQHWLTDRRYLRRIAAAAEIAAGETVLEVGAGTGLLTEELARVADKLIAVEIDPALAALLEEKFRGAANVRVLAADALTAPLEEMLGRGEGGLPYVVVGNLPYFAATAIVRRFLSETAPPRRMIVMLQREVAEAMAAAPGRMTYLSVQIQFLAEVQVLFRVPARAFRPSPNVESAVVRLTPHGGPAVEVDDAGRFLEFVRAGFAAPRKRLRNSLALGLRLPPALCERMLDRAGLAAALRPADLALDDWKRLYFAYRAHEAAA